MPCFTKIKGLITRWWYLFRKGLNNLEDWILDYLLPTIDDFAKILKVFVGVQSFTYWLILISGPIFIWFGLVLSSRGDNVVAPAFISLGASMIAVYWANVLQKITTSIPRAEWTRKISACSDDLVAYLLELNGSSVLVHSRKIYNRALKATGMQEIHATQDNIRKLESLLLKRNIEFLIKLTPHQLQKVSEYLALISRETDKISQNYGRPMANREFNRDFADLLSSLDEIIHILELIDRKKTPATNMTEKRIGLFSLNRSYAKDSIKRSTKIYVRSAHKKLIKAKPEAFWHTVMLVQYLQVLATFTNTYGYSNNAVLSIIKSRFPRTGKT